MLQLFLIIFSLAWLSIPVEADNQHAARTRPISRKPQIPVSFLPPKRPIATLEHMKAPLITRVVVKQAIPPTEIIMPTVIKASARHSYSSITTTNPLTTASLNRPVSNKKPAAGPGFLRKAAVFSTLRLTRKQAVYPEARSWATRLTPEEARKIADSIRQFLLSELSPATTALILLPPTRTPMNNPFPSALDDALRQAGFVLADSTIQAPHASIIRYRVCAVEGGLFVTLKINNRQASRYYLRTLAHGLLSISPYTVGR